MFKRILVVCVGNICRSPSGERLLQKYCPSLEITSAGIGALVGNPADPMASQVAKAQGLSLEGHLARQLTADIGRAADLILVMEPGHKQDISRVETQLSGKVMLFTHWTGGQPVADPYRLPLSAHESAFAQLDAAAQGWAKKLAPKT